MHAIVFMALLIMQYMKNFQERIFVRWNQFCLQVYTDLLQETLDGKPKQVGDLSHDCAMPFMVIGKD